MAINIFVKKTGTSSNTIGYILKCVKKQINEVDYFKTIDDWTSLVFQEDQNNSPPSVSMAVQVRVHNTPILKLNAYLVLMLRPFQPPRPSHTSTDQTNHPSTTASFVFLFVCFVVPVCIPPIPADKPKLYRYRSGSSRPHATTLRVQ